MPHNLYSNASLHMTKPSYHRNAMLIMLMKHKCHSDPTRISGDFSMGDELCWGFYDH